MNVPRHLTRATTTNVLLVAILFLASGCAAIIEGAIDAAIYDTPQKRRDRAMLNDDPYYGPEPSKKDGLRHKD